MRRKRKKVYRKGRQKVNKKLIIIVASICLGIPLLVGGAGLVFTGSPLYVFTMRGAEANIATGDAQMAEGEYKQAWKSYGRAVRKEPNNLQYIAKLKEAIAFIVPVTQTESRQMYDEYVRTLVHQARYNPLAIDTHLAVADEMYKSAYLTGQGANWQKLRIAAQTGIDRISPDNPQRQELMLYRGLASLRLEDASMTETYDDDGNVRFPGESDFEAVLERDPGNALAWASLAHGRMAVHYRLSDEGKTSQATVNRIFANNTMQKAIELAGDSFEVSAVVLREFLLQRTVLLQKKLADKDSVSQAEIDEATSNIIDARDALVATYDAAKNFVRAGEIATLLMATDTDGNEYAIALLQDTVALYHDDFGRMYMLAGLLTTENRKPEAITIYDTILEAPKQVVGLHAIELFTIQPMVAEALTRLKVEEAIVADNEEEKDRRIAEAIEYRTTLYELVSGNSTNRHLLYADGIIAFAKQDFRTAARMLEETINRNPDVDANVYRQAAFALSKTGSEGLAIDRLVTAIEKEPGNLSNYLAKARLEIQLNKTMDAAQTLSVLPDVAKGREDVSELLNLIAMQHRDESTTAFSDPVLRLVSNSEQLNRERNYEEAIALLSNAISGTKQDDWRLFIALSNTYAMSDNKEAAIIWIQKAIDTAPNPDGLLPQLHLLQSDNRVEALISLIDAKDWPEVQKAEELAVTLFELSMNFLGEANRWEQMGNDEAAMEAQEIADAALSESKKYQELAESLDADLSRIYSLKFSQQIAASNFEGAQETLELLRESGANQQEINSSDVSLLLAKAKQAKDYGKLDVFEMHTAKALVIAEKMTVESAISDNSWRAYGRVLVETGQLSAATKSYAEAYRIAPGKKENIRRYVGVLFAEKKDPQRLLRVLRSAAKQYPRDQQLNTAWLEAEAVHGQPWKVLVHRMNENTLNPQNRNNALELAFALTNATPHRDLVRNLKGEEVYSARVWEQMPAKMQVTVLREVRREWDKTIEHILQQSETMLDSNIRVANLHASIYRDLGQLQRASEIWDQFLASYKESERYTTAVLAAAEFLHKAGRTQQSFTLLEDARDSQSDKYEIDAALGTLNFIGGLYDAAAVYLQTPVDATHDPILESRLIESLALSGKFDEAEQAVENFLTTNTVYASAMLRALIHRVKSQQALAQGDLASGKMLLKQYRNALQTAIEVDSQNKTPYIQLSQSLLSEYRLTQDKALLEEALQVADAAIGTGKQTERFVIVRADVLQADGQISRSIDQLIRFIAENPNASLVRQRLIEAHLDAENVDRALLVAQDGVALNPSNAAWYRRLAELHLRANDDKGEAIKAYLQAVQRNPSVGLLLRIEEITRTDQELPNQDLLEIAKEQLAKLHPIAGAIEAKALFKLGRKRDAILAMERTWNVINNAIAKGWVPPQAILNWFLDLQVLFKDDATGGEAFASALVSGDFTPHQLAGLATYYHAFGEEYVNKSLEIIDAGLADTSADLDTSAATDARVQLLMMRGGYLVEAKRYLESEQAFRLLAKESNSPLVQNNLAYVVGVYQNRPAEGLIIAKMAAKAAPRNASIIDTVATMYERLGEYQKAAETLDFILLLDPTNSSAMAKLALLYSEHLGSPERGLVFALRGRSQNPYSPQVLDALGWAYYRLGKSEEGEESILRSLRQEDTMSAYLHLAQIVTDDLEFDKALGHLRMAQELAEDAYSLHRVEVLKDDIRKKKDHN